jgi:penicillin-binding protein 2
MLIFDQLKKNDLHLRFITWGALVGMAVLLAGLYYVQIISARDYAEDQISQSFRTVRIPSPRGNILDRNGVVLAENRPSYALGLYLEELRGLFQEEWKRTRPNRRLSRSERLEWEARARYRVASNITHQLSLVLQTNLNLDFETFSEHYSSQLALPLPLLHNLQPGQIARIQELPLHAPGVDLAPQPYRHYPHGTNAAHIVGYLTRDDSSAKDEDAFFNYRLPDYRGRVGIEGSLDDVLRGRAGVKSVLVNSMGYRQSETVWAPAEPGKHVYLTIDLQVQQAAERALQEIGSEPRAAAVVIDPNTGDIRALASVPAFDPNQFIPFINQEDYRNLQDPILRPQINRAVQENYAPGSIFKMVIGLACLETGLDPEESFYNPGYIRVRGRYINDLARPGYYDFRRGFLKSSNFYFITNGLRAGVEKIIQLGQRLHLGERTGLPTNQEVPGNFPSSSSIQRGWGIGDTANLCIGQGMIDVTPLQMAVVTAAVANGGKVLVPRLVDRIEPSGRYSDEPVQHFPSGQVRDELGVSSRALRLVREAMLADVEDPEGTGRAAGLPGLSICGKTGTAQVSNSKNQVIDQIAWFVSFAPYEQPRYVVVVMVESGVSGGATCAPVARKIYRALLDREDPSGSWTAQTESK